MSSLGPKSQTETGDAYVASLVRVLFGVMLLVSAARQLVETAAGTYFGDVFHLPIVPEALVPPRAIFLGLMVAQAALAVLAIAGRWGRPALLGAALIGIYVLLCDRLGYHNNRYALCLFAFLLAFAPCDRAFVWRRPPLSAEERVGPLWAQRLAQVQLSLIYLASGGSKLLDADWREGLVLGDRLARGTAMAVARGVPPELMELLSSPAASSLLAKAAISIELFLAIGLLLPRTRYWAMYLGILFHLTIEVTSRVELFGWLSLTVYALFARPAIRERSFVYDPEQAAARALARAVRWTDWLARFQVRAGGAELADRGFVVVDRDGSEASGFEGFARLTRAIPLLFPLSGPLLAVAFVGSKLGRGSGGAGSAARI